MDWGQGEQGQSTLFLKQNKKFNMKNMLWPEFYIKQNVMPFGKGICVSNWFLCWTQASFIVLPRLLTWWWLSPITTVSVLFCCTWAVIAAQSSITRFIQGSNPSNFPQTHLPLLDFNNNFLSSIHFFQFEPGELYSGYLLGRVTDAVKQFCLYVFSKVSYFI